MLGIFQMLSYNLKDLTWKCRLFILSHQYHIVGGSLLQAATVVVNIIPSPPISSWASSF